MKLQEQINKIQSIMGINDNHSLWLKRRFDISELNDLVRDIKNQIEKGESLDTAIYDTIRQFIASKQFNDINDNGIEQDYWDSYLKYEEPLVKYVKKKLEI